MLAVILIVVLAIFLLAFAALSVFACAYYLGAYARSTKHYFIDTLRDPRAFMQHKLGVALTGSRNKGEVWTLFDVEVPSGDKEPTLADCIAVAPDRCHVFCVAPGRNAFSGNNESETWLSCPSKGTDDDTTLIPNYWKEARLAAAATAAHLEIDPHLVVPHVVFDNKADVSGLDFVDELPEWTLLRQHEVHKAFSPKQNDTENTTPLFDSEMRKRMARLLRVGVRVDAVNPDNEGLRARAEQAGRKAVMAVRGGHDEAVEADILRRADKIAAAKGDFDGVSWNRVMELCDRMMLESDPDTRADLNAQVRLIARANLSLSYRLGIPLGQTNIKASEEITTTFEHEEKASGHADIN